MKEGKKMKLLHLKMKAFLAYKDEISIDFDQFNEGLYLISGPTGSGKTAIFDAIVFALYGQSSGQRNSQSLRSDYAENREETYVELVFEILGQRYMIKRTPAYKREGYKTLKQAHAILKMNDTYIEGVKEVNQKVIEILGINYEQFKQIVMISQGEFTRLIYASSEDREKVLRRIFNTYSLLDLEKNLKEKVRSYKEQYELSEHILSSSLQMLELDEKIISFHPKVLKTIEKDIDLKKQEKKELEKQYQDIEQLYLNQSQDYMKKTLINEKIKELDQYHQQYNALLQKDAEMTKMKNDIQQLQNIQQNADFIISYRMKKQQYQQDQKAYHDSLEQKERIVKEYHQQKEAYSSIAVIRQEKEKISLKINELKQNIERRERYLEYKKRYDHEKIILDDIEKQYQQLLKQKEKQQARMQRDQEKVDKLPDLLIELKDMDQMVQNVNEKRILIHELSELYDHLQDEQEKHYTLSNAYNEATKKYNKAFENYHYQDELYKRQQAGILALELKENEPCPVCGSLHHPHIAQISGHVLSASQLQELSKKLSQLLREKDDAYQQVVLQNEAKTQALTQLSLLKKQLHIEGELNKRVFIEQLSFITSVIEERKKKYQKLHEEAEYLRKLKASLERDQTVVKQRDQQIERLFKQMEEKRSDIVYLNGQMKEYDQGLVNNDLHQEYQKNIDQYQHLDKKINDIENQYHQIEKEMIAMNKQLEYYQNNIQVQQKELAIQDQQYLDYIKTYFKDEETFLKYYKILNQKAKKEKDYQDYLLEKEKMMTHIQMLEKEVKDEKYHDLASLKTNVEKLKEEKDQLQNKYQQLKIKIENNQKVFKTIQKEYKNNQKVLKNYQQYLHLSDMTSGKNALKISFERYVLSFYFENILQYANIEFSTMTQGRYQLMRKTEVKGNSKQGLDLSILDYETGIQRDIQSLSGGESFKAALSLALGLSSMIQSYVGGIELNTLFIDEGFGTLDEESLNQAIEVLMRLKDHHKMIGIISHINELKEKIEDKIIVTKGQQGSHLKIEFHN